MNKAELETFLKTNGVESPKGNKTELLAMAHDILDNRELTGDTLPPATPADTGDTIPFAPAE